MQKIITISREFGSGGREVGLALAKQLGITFYDKELVSLVGKNDGLSENILAQHEESLIKGLSFAGIGVSLFAHYQQSVSDQIYIAQSKAIRALATQGSCVIVGRCADYVLGDSAIRVFIYADLKARIARKGIIEMNERPTDMEKHILTIDKKRKKYYEYYTDKNWGDPTGYHLRINTTAITTTDAADIIAIYAQRFVQEVE